MEKQKAQVHASRQHMTAGYRAHRPPSKLVPQATNTPSTGEQATRSARRSILGHNELSPAARPVSPDCYTTRRTSSPVAPSPSPPASQTSRARHSYGGLPNAHHHPGRFALYQRWPGRHVPCHKPGPGVTPRHIPLSLFPCDCSPWPLRSMHPPLHVGWGRVRGRPR